METEFSTLNAIERAISLLFFFGRTNDCQWTHLFLLDCFKLKEKFPLLYDSYMNGGFVLNTTRNSRVSFPFDQGSAITSLPKWVGDNWGCHEEGSSRYVGNLIKHKKTKMKDDLQRELSFYHDFNPSIATTIVRMVQDIEEYLLKVCCPLTGEIMTNVAVDKLLYRGQCCLC